MALENRQPEEEDETLDNQGEKGPDKKQSPDESFNKAKLTGNELNRLEKGQTSISKIKAERDNAAKAAEAELKGLVTSTAEEGNVIDLKEYKEYRKEIDETESAEKMEDLLEKIKDLPKEKAKQRQQEKEDSVELDPEDPKLLKLQREFDTTCLKNAKYIGENQLPGFIAWFRQERKSTPTVKHLKGLIRRLEGEEVNDKGGLAPRRKEYRNLEKIFQKYKAGKPEDSDWIKKEGLSERQDYRKTAEDMETHLGRLKDTKLYSQEFIAKTMKEMLTSKTPEVQSKLLLNAKNIARKETESFTHLDAEITINGVTMRKMSEKSKDKLLDYYKDASFEERKQSDFKKLAEYEAQLAEDLSEIYEDDKEGFKLAIGSFSTMDFMEKQKAVVDHKKAVEKSNSKEELHKELTIKAAHAKIDEAARKKIVSSETQKKYKEWFKDEKQHKDPKTGKPGDLETMKKHYKLLTSNTPDGKARNLSAYRVKRERFQKELKELQDINPKLNKSDLNAWQDKYDKQSWTDRKKTYKEMKKEVEKDKKEQAKIRAQEEKVDIQEEDKEKAREGDLDKGETIKSVIELMHDSQAAEAMKLLLLFNEQEPDDPKIMFWVETVGKYMKEFGSGKKLEESTEKQIDDEIERLASEDQSIKDDLEQANLETLNINAVRMSEERHSRKISAQDRASKESLARAEDGSMEKDLIEDFYEQTDDQHILNEDETGEEIGEIRFDGVDMTKEERSALKTKTRGKQGKIFNKEGFTHESLLDKTGRQISSEEAESTQAKGSLEKLEDNIANKALKKVDTKTKGKDAEVFNLQARIAAKRKAKDKVDEERNRVDRLAA